MRRIDEFEDYCVEKTVNLDKGMTLRVENDDWGYFVSVIDKDRYRHYLSELIIWEDELEGEITKVKLLFNSL